MRDVELSARGSRRELWIVAPFLLYVIHSLLYIHWIVDDAGVSFAYARNLARGYGLVSQPGATPVEGYSNFSWVLLCAALERLRMFDPHVTPKLLAVLFVFGTYLLLFLSLESANRLLVRLAPLCLLAINTPFVVWTSSGLENSLYAFFLALLLYLSTAASGPRSGRRTAVVAGVVAAAAAFTRPEAVLICLAYPAGSLLCRQQWPAKNPPPSSLISIFALTFAALVAGLIAFRWNYFGDVVPNTFYAKAVFSPAGLYVSILQLLSSIYGGSQYAVALLLVVATGTYVGLNRQPFQVALGAFTLLVGTSAVALPPDWMGESRFFTAFAMFFYSLVSVVVADVITKAQAVGGRLRVFRLSLWLAIVCVLAGSTYSYAQRSASFAKHPTVPMDVVQRRFVQRFDAYAAMMRVENASVLLPDIGAMLLYSHLRVIDLAGLTDRTIAKSLFNDRPRLLDYIFETTKPTFIHIHGPWTHIASFDRDIRLQRDYILLCDGDYVREAVVRGHEERSALRDQCMQSSAQ